MNGLPERRSECCQSTKEEQGSYNIQNRQAFEKKNPEVLLQAGIVCNEKGSILSILWSDIG